MLAYTAGFASAILSNQRLAFRAEILQSGQVTSTFDLAWMAKGGKKSGSVNAGYVTISATAAQRRSISFSIPGSATTLIPTSSSSTITPFGNEIKLYSGFMVNGVAELKSLGVFYMTNVKVEDNGGSISLSIEGFDRSQRVSRALFGAPYVVASGTNVATAIQAMISSRVSGLQYAFATTTYTTPALTYREGDDPWKSASQLALAAGMQLYFDVQGVCCLSAIPDPATQPIVWTYADNPTTSTIHEIVREFNNNQVYNDIYVAGEGTNVTTPIIQRAFDSDPNSPTYLSGAYGDVPFFVREASIKTSAQALASAQNLLQRYKGGAENLTLKVVPNPCHDVYDAIHLTRARMGLNYDYIIDSIRFPIGPATTPMEIQARRISSSV